MPDWDLVNGGACDGGSAYQPRPMDQPQEKQVGEIADAMIDQMIDGHMFQGRRHRQHFVQKNYIGKAEDDWEAEQKKKARKANAKNKTACPECGKKVKGLKDHIRDVHKMGQHADDLMNECIDAMSDPDHRFNTGYYGGGLPDDDVDVMGDIGPDWSTLRDTPSKKSLLDFDPATQWKKGNGTVTAIRDMDDGHLVNTLNYLARNDAKHHPCYPHLATEYKRRKDFRP